MQFLGMLIGGKKIQSFPYLYFFSPLNQGSGGFGDVLKVRNNLDGNIYAIKRILLDRKSRQLNKKITREVKLLSRLNHENIVRYYNSWIETAQANEPSMRYKLS